MQVIRRGSVISLGLVALLGGASSPLLAASHLWVIQELYSNADGTIQYVEMYNCCAANETGLSTRYVISHQTGHKYTFTQNLPPNSTTDKYILLATQGFADLPGAPTPDHLIIDGFFAIGGDEVQWWQYSFPDSSLTFAPGQLPTDGLHSLNQDGNGAGVVGIGTPRNFAGKTFAPPGVSGLTVEKIPLFPQASRLVLNFDDSSCLGAGSYGIIHGFGSGLPTGGGAYVIGAAAPGQCAFGSSPKTWSGVPDPVADPSRLLWFLVVARDGQGAEGAWGADSGGLERQGPGAGGSSGQCGVTGKSLLNTCGQ